VQRILREVDQWNLASKKDYELSFSWALAPYVTGSDAEFRACAPSIARCIPKNTTSRRCSEGAPGWKLGLYLGLSYHPSRVCGCEFSSALVCPTVPPACAHSERGHDRVCQRPTVD